MSQDKTLGSLRVDGRFYRGSGIYFTHISVLLAACTNKATLDKDLLRISLNNLKIFCCQYGELPCLFAIDPLLPLQASQPIEKTQLSCSVFCRAGNLSPTHWAYPNQLEIWARLGSNFIDPKKPGQICPVESISIGPG